MNTIQQIIRELDEIIESMLVVSDEDTFPILPLSELATRGILSAKSGALNSVQDRHLTSADDFRAGVNSGDRAKVVLVIEDEPAIRMLITDVSEEFGYSVIEAIDGPTGLEAVRSSSTIDLLIADVSLPGGVTGPQIADVARSLKPELKVLFITGYGESSVACSRPLEAGTEILTKPFSVNTLASRVRAMIET